MNHNTKNKIIKVSNTKMTTANKPHTQLKIIKVLQQRQYGHRQQIYAFGTRFYANARCGQETWMHRTQSDNGRANQGMEKET